MDGIASSSFYDRLSRQWLDVRCGALTPLSNYAEAVDRCKPIYGKIDSTTASPPVTVYFSEEISRDEVRSKGIGGHSDVILGVWLSPHVSRDILAGGANTVVSLELRDNFHESPLQTYFLRPGEYATAIGDRTFCANGPSFFYGSEMYLTVPSRRDVPPLLKKHVRLVCALYNCSDARRKLYSRHTMSDLGDGRSCQTINGLFRVFVREAYCQKRGADTIAQHREQQEYDEYPMLCGPYTGPPDRDTRLRTVETFMRELVEKAWAPRRHVNWCLDMDERAEIFGNGVEHTREVV
jgi:hypothetical protein